MYASPTIADLDGDKRYVVVYSDSDQPPRELTLTVSVFICFVLF